MSLPAIHSNLHPLLQNRICDGSNRVFMCGHHRNVYRPLKALAMLVRHFSSLQVYQTPFIQSSGQSPLAVHIELRQWKVPEAYDVLEPLAADVSLWMGASLFYFSLCLALLCPLSLRTVRLLSVY